MVDHGIIALRAPFASTSCLPMVLFLRQPLTPTSLYQVGKLVFLGTSAQNAPCSTPGGELLFCFCSAAQNEGKSIAGAKEPSERYPAATISHFRPCNSFWLSLGADRFESLALLPLIPFPVERTLSGDVHVCLRIEGFLRLVRYCIIAIVLVVTGFDSALCSLSSSEELSEGVEVLNELQESKCTDARLTHEVPSLLCRVMMPRRVEKSQKTRGKLNGTQLHL
ncbi:hypothetical protein K437DRAFT_255094 [Tilletiaria anomala UBC 951]|uniref:Uncharacterized protein n=1 Tax=Tilletiaria anomala (strain ATCC 24038 / CBS 436.72 / UBC 951) TaxID=1037660 RepID=A0A066WCZ7_TILAU|nr:uncharacterized protein K437DRAFT_255094 [Tilletiaria anomala UBC 951]KDN50388.1 hypothetical protein K437DRAFT_255094 [Tilletiaria anomala UBC 951]